MTGNNRALWVGLALAGLGLLPAPARAGFETYDVTLDTSPLVGSPDTFSVDLQLNDGSGTGDGNNTAIISNIAFGGGSASGTTPFVPAGGVAAGSSLSGGVTITDSSATGDEYAENFTPGATLSFRLQITTSSDGPIASDEFLFGLLDNGATILTTAPDGLGFFEVNLTPPGPDAEAYAAADGSMSAPTVTQEGQVAETPAPPSLVLAVVGIGLLSVPAWRKLFLRRPAAVEA